MRWYPDKSQPGFIDPGHKGPCAVYMKKVNSASQESGAGDGWFKIFEDGYDPATDKFCTEKLNDSNGELSVKLPHGILGGEYLIRTEITALHLTGSPQLYVGCAQIFVVSTGTGVPCSTVSIPGYVTQNDPITQYSVYNRPFVLPFPFFGPPVYLGGESGTVDAPQQTEGFCPPNTVVENGDWCGEEVPLYHDTQSCWDVSTGLPILEISQVMLIVWTRFTTHAKMQSELQCIWSLSGLVANMLDIVTTALETSRLPVRRIAASMARNATTSGMPVSPAISTHLPTTART